MHRSISLLLALILVIFSSMPSSAQGPALYLPVIRDEPSPTPRATNTRSPTPTVRPSATTTLTHTSMPTQTPIAVSSNTPTRTSTATPTNAPAVTPTATTSATVIEQLLLNGDFEQGSVHWGQTSNGIDVALIQEDVGRWSSWGAKLGGRFYAEDAIAQPVYIPTDAQLAFVGFSVKMTTFESTTESHSTLIVSLHANDTSVLSLLGSYDNTDTSYIWTRLYSGDLTPHRGQTVWVMASVQTEGLTTFYLDDFTFLVERPGS